MNPSRRLQFSPSFTLTLAADARLSRTDYVDDQSWELSPGQTNAPALALQTRYGGRVGLVSLVPMWVEGGRSVYEAQSYAAPPTLTSFAPGFARLHANILPEVELTTEVWVMESHAVGSRYTLHNNSGRDIALRLDLFGHVATEEKGRNSAILTLEDQTNALAFGTIGNLEPVIVLENARAVLTPGQKASPKIGVDVRLATGETISLRWVHAGLNKMSDSLQRAQFWLAQDWNVAFAQIEQAAQAIPQIETGDAALDTLLAYAYHEAVQAFLRPTDKLPYGAFVANRQPNRGYSKRGDGSDYDRSWNGQHPHVAYLLTTAIAPIAPALAQGVLRNYLAVQAADGFIDFKPGAGGQRTGILCPPLLARLTWQIYFYTQDKVFLQETFPNLVRFFQRWFTPDVDANQNGLPEWQDDRQTGYTAWPTFSPRLPWAQGLDIRATESPDLAAMLYSEALHLQAIAREIGNNEAFSESSNHLKALEATLEALWHSPINRYVYRDRDTGGISTGTVVLKDERGDEELFPVIKLTPPSRLIVKLSGGTGRAPRISLYLEGLDHNGQTISETIEAEAFAWTYNSGIVTSSKTYAQIDRVRFTGLSRVYRVSVYAVDHTRSDINNLLPLIAEPSSEKRDLLIRTLSESHYLRPNGVSMVSAQDPNFDPSSANGGGGVWSFFTTLLGEGLIEHGEYELAADLLKRLLRTQAAVLQEQDHLSEFYHTDQPRGLGEADYIGGMVPLHLLLLLIGIVIRADGSVTIDPVFAWGAPVTLTQHGIRIERTSAKTTVTFLNGHMVEVPADGNRHKIEAPDGTASRPEITLPAPPELTGEGGHNRVIIAVQDESDQA